MMKKAEVGVANGEAEDSGGMTVVEVATGEVATGEVATGEVATGEVATGEVATGEVATGEVATGEVATGEAEEEIFAVATGGTIDHAMCHSKE
jgi:hypothetical protein